MKINQTNEFEQIRQPRQSGDVKTTDKDKIAANEPKISRGEDKIEVSSRASEVGKLVDQLKDLPDVRQKRVEALRGKIAAGEFNPSGEDIADAILNDEK